MRRRRVLGRHAAQGFQVLGGLLLGLVIVKLAALERQRLLVVGDRLVALALLLIGPPAIDISPGIFMFVPLLERPGAVGMA